MSLLGGTNCKRNDATVGRRVVLHMSLCRRESVDDASNFFFPFFLYVPFLFVFFFAVEMMENDPHGLSCLFKILLSIAADSAGTVTADGIG